MQTLFLTSLNRCYHCRSRWLCSHFCHRMLCQSRKWTPKKSNFKGTRPYLAVGVLAFSMVFAAPPCHEECTVGCQLLYEGWTQKRSQQQQQQRTQHRQQRQNNSLPDPGNWHVLCGLWSFQAVRPLYVASNPSH